jgi:hypothetical protein
MIEVIAVKGKKIPETLARVATQVLEETGSAVQVVANTRNRAVESLDLPAPPDSKQQIKHALLREFAVL